MSPKRTQYDDDDGRTIVDMDVEGMRWYNRGTRRGKFASLTNTYGEQMSRTEARQYTWYSMIAAGLIVFVFSATWVLFVLFCIYVWFR